jgi:hypothetical protein
MSGALKKKKIRMSPLQEQKDEGLEAPLSSTSNSSNQSSIFLLSELLLSACIRTGYFCFEAIQNSL